MPGRCTGRAATRARRAPTSRPCYAHVPVLDSGSRGATTTFAERGLGDVLLAWENEAWLAQAELGPGKVEIVVPSSSILAEPPVAVVDKVVDKHGTRAVAEAYLRGLYTDPAQDLIGKNFYRPRSAAALAKYARQFPNIPMVTIADLGGWSQGAEDPLRRRRRVRPDLRAALGQPVAYPRRRAAASAGKLSRNRRPRRGLCIRPFQGAAS